MNMNLKNTEYEFKLADGSSVKTSIAFYLLYQLKEKHASLYKRFNRILSNLDKDDFDLLDMVTVVYVGYVCANLKAEKIYSEEEFLALCGTDIKGISQAVTALVRPK